MKITPRVLACSIALNLVLLGSVAYLVMRGSAKQEDTGTPPPVASSGKIPSAGTFQSAPAPLFASQPPAGDTGSGALETTSPALPEQKAVAPQVPTAEQETKGAIPAVFVEPDPAWKLSEDQLDAIDMLRQSFVDAVGGENQNPSDPEYLRRWRQAQVGVDRQLKALLGADIYNRLQLEAARQQSNLPDQ